MSPRIKDATVEAVLAAADIVDVVSGYTSLRQRGVTFTGLCPFHQEKSPSFSVSADKGLYYCFGCGEGGDVLTFVQRMESLSFAEAVEQLAERFGVPLEYEQGAAPDSAARGTERRLSTLLEKTAAFYSRYLWESKAGENARVYLRSRGLARAVCETYQVGLSPDAWRGLHDRALQEGFTERDLEAAGLIVRRPGKAYDRFRGRLMFPLADHRGRVVGFGGRTLGDDKPKYLNSPEGPLYRKSHLLYGLFQARRTIADADDVLVVEGYTDVLALAQAGVGNVVASMGTALTDGQLDLVTRLTSNVTFMYDADRAGTEAVMRSGELARRRGLRPTVAVLPGGQDPAEVATAGGGERVRTLVGGKVSLLRFEVLRFLERSDTDTAEGRVRAFDGLREILARSTSPKEREEEVRLLADRLRLSPENVAYLLEESEREARNRVKSATRPQGGEVRLLRDHRERMRSPELAVQREFLTAALANPDTSAEALAGLTPEHFVDPVCAEAFAGLRRALTSPDPKRVLKELIGGDTEVGRFVIGLVMEADTGLYTQAMLNERHLRLQEQHLRRTVAGLRTSLEDDASDADTERRLVRLEVLLHQVRYLLANVDEG
ncbi:MAG: DNA primase [Thermoleophilia bacterium]|nr:DNA primase [Thermoleophilia bacterium]